MRWIRLGAALLALVGVLVSASVAHSETCAKTYFGSSARASAASCVCACHTACTEPDVPNRPPAVFQAGRCLAGSPVSALQDFVPEILKPPQSG